MTTLKVTFTKCDGSFEKRATGIVTPTADDGCYTEREVAAEAINRAVEKVYGKSAFWWSDSGLGLDYGQVMKALKPSKRNSNPGNSALTGRVRIDISAADGTLIL